MNKKIREEIEQKEKEQKEKSKNNLLENYVFVFRQYDGLFLYNDFFYKCCI